jgi:hypothetical protein
MYLLEAVLEWRVVGVSSYEMPTPEVEMLSWPADAGRLEALRDAAIPRLVLVAAGTSAPVLDDELEDWVRLPADDQEISLRSQRLARHAREDRLTRPQLNCLPDTDDSEARGTSGTLVSQESGTFHG